MATTYLSAASETPSVSSSGGSSSVLLDPTNPSDPSETSSSTSSSNNNNNSLNNGIMNLVNGLSTNSAYGVSTGHASSTSPLPPPMHETKYLHNGHHPLHNPHHPHHPWVPGIPGDPSSHWAAAAAMHHPGLYATTQQDLKQDIKPEFHHNNRTTSSSSTSSMVTPISHAPSSWNTPPPVSSPYLGMTGPNSPLQHHYGGMGGMLPGGPMGVSGGGVGAVPPGSGGHWVSAAGGTDRYHHRDSHNSSPRSGTDEDGMQTPTSGTSTASPSAFFPDSAGKELKYL